MDTLGRLLEDYQAAIAVFYGLRSLSPDNDQRRAVIEKLHQFRIGGNGRLGLEPLLRRYLVRNRKEAQQREYALVVRDGGSLLKQPFKKFADLKGLCARLPLDSIHWTGCAVLPYSCRELIQEVIEQSRPETNARRTFVAMDLQQGLSSYPQLLTPAGAGKPKRLLERSGQRLAR